MPASCILSRAQDVPYLAAMLLVLGVVAFVGITKLGVSPAVPDESQDEDDQHPWLTAHAGSTLRTTLQVSAPLSILYGIGVSGCLAFSPHPVRALVLTSLQLSSAILLGVVALMLLLAHARILLACLLLVVIIADAVWAMRARTRRAAATLALGAAANPLALPANRPLLRLALAVSAAWCIICLVWAMALSHVL